MAATKDGRVKILELFRLLREMKFAWEFPNGLEIGRFARGDGVDDELLTALLTHEVDPLTNRVVGGYRLYVPLESFDHRERYRKLKPFEEQNRVIRWLAQSGLEQINFGVVIPPDAEEATFRGIADGFTALQQIIRTSGAMEARYAAFHLIPIAEFRGMRTKYSVDEFPEGWNFYFPVYDGTQMTARELFERRIALVQQIDPANFESMKIGQYTYA